MPSDLGMPRDPLGRAGGHGHWQPYSKHHAPHLHKWQKMDVPEQYLAAQEEFVMTHQQGLKPDELSACSVVDYSMPAPINFMPRLCTSTPLYPSLTPSSPSYVHGLKSA